MITGVRWFSGRDCVGVVQVVPDHQVEEYRQTGMADFKYYIGVGHGLDEKWDTKLIADHGSKFDVAAGNTLFRIL